MTTYTAFVAWPKLYGDREAVEEIDVEASNPVEAAALAGVELAANYEKGWEIIGVRLANVVRIWSI